MRFGAITTRVRKVTADNAPTILTAIGATGLVTTAVLTGQATFKYAKFLTGVGYFDAEYEFKDWTAKDHVEKAWKYYMPSLATMAVTGACIVCANNLNMRRTAALASAYSIVQEGMREYKGKVLETIGEKKEQKIRDDIGADRLKKNPPTDILLIEKSGVLCMDMHTGRYFKGSLEELKKAENDTNYQILHNDYASVSDYWDRIGLPKTAESDEIGWNTDARLEVEYGSTIAEDGTPCITINFRTIPIRGYYSLH